MPAKKEQIALQKEILNQEMWDELLSLEGLTVIDVYQKWCGPCAAVLSIFKRLRNEIGDDLLRFAVAEADSIESLEKYRGKCEPSFLMYGSGHLVNVIRGANAPALFKNVERELKQEHKVLEEGVERVVIKDPLLAAFEAEEQQAAQAEELEKKRLEEEARIKELKELGEEGEVSVRPISQGTIDTMMHDRQAGSETEPVPKEVTVVLIKPDAVANGHVDDIISKIEEHGFEILATEDKTLTEDEAREFYKQHEEEEHYEELVTFMASGPSKILVLTRGDTGEGVVSDVRNLLGPKDIEVAKEEAPESLRAQFGTDKKMNAMHGADSSETAARELAFLLPNFNIPIVPGTGPPPAIEKTLALIRPSALKDHKDEMIQKIQEAGFEVCLQKMVQLTEEQAKEFYREQEGTPHFEDLIREMTSGEVLALGLAKESAIQSWRDFIGPTIIDEAKEKAPESLRAQYSIPDAQINVVHGSDSVETAEKELGFFFPKQTTLAVIKPDAAGEHKEAIIEKIKEAGFNISLQRDLELNKELASKLYLEHEGKEFYENLIEHMSSGLSMVMVLSREDAVDGWRTLMGPTDPEYAREHAPESLRALLGKDVLQNAVHGSSNPEEAKTRIERLFPDVEVLPGGEVKVKGEGEEGGEQQAEQPAGESGEQQAEGGEQQAAEGEGTSQEQQGEAEGVESEQQGVAGEGTDGEAQQEEGGQTEEGQTQEAQAEQQAEAGEEKKAGDDEAPPTDAPPTDAAEDQADAEQDHGQKEEQEDGEGEKPAEEDTQQTQEGEAPAAEQTEQTQEGGEDKPAEPAEEAAPAASEESGAEQTEQAPAAEETQQTQEGEEKKEEQTEEAPAAEGGEAAATEGETQAAEGGETQAAEGGETQAADGGEAQAAEGGETQATEGGETQAAEGGGGDAKPEEAAQNEEQTAS
ncbi:thioredoxin domain-containing protein 3 homolog isoform X4 [Lytechinus variegatus]|uniref:thioredoxin domain-containing protein 3 homolog isoform X4 n=1 Tax=Lytechinus variegatus TaxID=7654 RepID=UPI001BB192D9|nr:thioredoxin domain-containing protein 3 homolog isoform X4 [Lytechinus variegatus]